MTGSAGTLFLYGIVVGAAGLLGLSLLLAGARRTSRRGSAARRGLRQSRRETAAASRERDDLIGERDAARATAGEMGNGTAQLSPDNDRQGKLRALMHRYAPGQAAVTTPGSPASEAGADAPERSVAPEVPAGATTSAE